MTTASDRLRALDGAMTPGPWVTGSKVGFPVSDVIALRNALPLIVDVVEAAEESRGDLPWTSQQRIDAALTALREHLKGGGE